MHPLDDVIWQALTTRQAHFAEGAGRARKFVYEVSPLAAFQEEGPDGYASLAELLTSPGTAGLFLDHPYEPLPGWSYVAGAPLLQMVCENGAVTVPLPGSPPTIEELGDKDSPEMIELTNLTKPGPFGTRTHELGTYVGIRREGKLIAMAGERLKIPGHTGLAPCAPVPSTQVKVTREFSCSRSCAASVIAQKSLSFTFGKTMFAPSNCTGGWDFATESSVTLRC